MVAENTARLYLGVFNLIINEFFDPIIHANQYGFRTGIPGYRAWLAIINQILYFRSRGIEFRIYELDLLGFFPNIHKSLLNDMYINKMRVPNRFIYRVAAFDKIPLLLDGKLQRSRTGLPQGAASSPLLANLVLNELGLLEALPGGSSIFRYVDD